MLRMGKSVRMWNTIEDGIVAELWKDFLWPAMVDLVICYIIPYLLVQARMSTQNCTKRSDVGCSKILVMHHHASDRMVVEYFLGAAQISKPSLAVYLKYLPIFRVPYGAGVCEVCCYRCLLFSFEALLLLVITNFLVPRLI